jgi:F0F1-type ATP synthase assembly protein I
MTILFIILGGVVGGGLGWLFDKVTQRKQPATTKTPEAST